MRSNLLLLLAVTHKRGIVSLPKRKDMNRKIAIIGGGNLGTAIAEGLLKSKFSNAADITITKRNTSTLETLRNRGVVVTDDNASAVRKSNVVILAVKPFQVSEVLNGIKNELNDQLLISVVTGVTIQEMKEILEKQSVIFRAMPNTAIAIQESMTCLCSANAAAADKEYVQELFSKLGKVVSIDEKLMEAATILGACGTAYAMRYIRANIQGGIEIGFDALTASLIAAQTV